MRFFGFFVLTVMLASSLNANDGQAGVAAESTSSDLGAIETVAPDAGSKLEPEAKIEALRRLQARNRELMKLRQVRERSWNVRHEAYLLSIAMRLDLDEEETESFLRLAKEGLLGKEDPAEYGLRQSTMEDSVFLENIGQVLSADQLQAFRIINDRNKEVEVDMLVARRMANLSQYIEFTQEQSEKLMRIYMVDANDYVFAGAGAGLESNIENQVLEVLDESQARIYRGLLDLQEEARHRDAILRLDPQRGVSRKTNSESQRFDPPASTVKQDEMQSSEINTK